VAPARGCKRDERVSNESVTVTFAIVLVGMVFAVGCLLGSFGLPQRVLRPRSSRTLQDR